MSAACPDLRRRRLHDHRHARRWPDGAAARRTRPRRSCPRRSSRAGRGSSRRRPWSRWRAPAAAGPGRPRRPARPASPSCRPAWPGRARPPRRGRCRSRRPATGGRRPRPGTAPGPRTCDGQRAPAARARLDQQLRAAGRGRPVQQRQQRLAHLAQRRRRRASASTALPAWKTTAARADRARPARSACASTSHRLLDRRRRSASRGSPAARRGCTRARPARAQPARNASSCAGSPGGQRPAARSWTRTPAPPRRRPRPRTAARPWPARRAVGACDADSAGRQRPQPHPDADLDVARRHLACSGRVLEAHDAVRVEVDPDPQALRPPAPAWPAGTAGRSPGARSTSGGPLLTSSLTSAPFSTPAPSVGVCSITSSGRLVAVLVLLDQRPSPSCCRLRAGLVDVLADHARAR